MVDHPDFCSERELRKSKQTMPLQLLRDRAEDDDEDDSAENNEDKKKEEGGVMPSSANTTAAVDTSPLANFNPAMQRRSLSSIRSGVTVAMVAVALGFACCKFDYICCYIVTSCFKHFISSRRLGFSICFNIQARTYCIYSSITEQV